MPSNISCLGRQPGPRKYVIKRVAFGAPFWRSWAIVLHVLGFGQPHRRLSLLAGGRLRRHGTAGTAARHCSYANFRGESTEALRFMTGESCCCRSVGSFRFRLSRHAVGRLWKPESGAEDLQQPGGSELHDMPRAWKEEGEIPTGCCQYGCGDAPLCRTTTAGLRTASLAKGHLSRVGSFKAQLCQRGCWACKTPYCSLHIVNCTTRQEIG